MRCERLLTALNILYKTLKLLVLPEFTVNIMSLKFFVKQESKSARPGNLTSRVVARAALGAARPIHGPDSLG